MCSKVKVFSMISSELRIARQKVETEVEQWRKAGKIKIVSTSIALHSTKEWSEVVLSVTYVEQAGVASVIQHLKDACYLNPDEFLRYLCEQTCSYEEANSLLRLLLEAKVAGFHDGVFWYRSVD